MPPAPPAGKRPFAALLTIDSGTCRIQVGFAGLKAKTQKIYSEPDGPVLPSG
jgi:hypothetical protein